MHKMERFVTHDTGPLKQSFVDSADDIPTLDIDLGTDLGFDGRWFGKWKKRE